MVDAKGSGDWEIIVGGSPEDDAAAFAAVAERLERGEAVPPQPHVLAFQDWEALLDVLSGDRYRLLRHVHARPAASVSALARELGREHGGVRRDIAALEAVGLIDRSGGLVRAAADRLHADIEL